MSSNKVSESNHSNSLYETALNNSYDLLFKYIRNDLFSRPRIVTIAKPFSRLVASMHSFDITEVLVSIKKHIRRKLENEFAGSLHIFPDEKGKLLVLTDNRSLYDLARHNQRLQAELDTFSNMPENVVSKAAMQLRLDVVSNEYEQGWPPQVTYSESLIAESITRFLIILLSSKQDNIQVMERVQRLVRSFDQDMVYAISQGRPPKHIVLPFAVKSLTGNIELIHILNRLGHSVSYSKVQEIDTALCLQKLSVSTGDVALPGNIFSNVFTTLAWDNIDRLEETLSGENTSQSERDCSSAQTNRSPNTKNSPSS